MEQNTQPRIPIPTPELVDAALRNAREERSRAAHQAFQSLGRTVRRLWTQFSALDNGAAAR